MCRTLAIRWSSRTATCTTTLPTLSTRLLCPASIRLGWLARGRRILHAVAKDLRRVHTSILPALLQVGDALAHGQAIERAVVLPRLNGRILAATLEDFRVVVRDT